MQLRTLFAKNFALRQKRSPNDTTLESYNRDISGYIQNTPQFYTKEHEPLLHWIDKLLELVPSDAAILEVGTGSGRDADYIESKGRSILRTDGAENFVDRLKNHGKRAVVFNILTENLPSGYQVIFANAVMPHFTEKETIKVMRKIFNYLQPGGIFAFSVKQGTGSVWTDEKMATKRYIHYWQAKKIVAEAKRVGFRVMYKDQDIMGDLKSHIWTHLILEKA